MENELSIPYLHVSFSFSKISGIPSLELWRNPIALALHFSVTSITSGYYLCICFKQNDLSSRCY